MAYGVGIALSLIVVCFARATRFDRDRAFYPTVLMVVASYYVLFGAMSGSLPVVIFESIVMIVFLSVAVIGFKVNLWLVVVGLSAHGLFDGFHDLVSTNPGVPEWWPAFCLTFDVGTAVLLAWLLLRAKVAARARSETSPA